MISVSTRQKLIVVISAVLVLALLVAAIFAQWRIALALTGVVLTAILIVLLDVRRRTGQLRLGPSDQRELKAILDRLKSQSAHTSELVSSLERVQSTVRNQSEQLTSSHHDVMTQIHQQAREVEALIQLFAKVTPRAPMPSTRPWAPSAPDLLELVSLVERQRPALVRELGSGTSTVWLSYALVGTGNGRLISIEHLEEFAERTRDAIVSHGLGTFTEVRLAPLEPIQLGGKETYLWYDQATLTDLDQIDMIFIDGPPGGTRPEATYPALPVLLDRLADDAMILLTSADPADQQKVVEKWLDEIPGIEREATIVGSCEVLRFRRTHAS